LKKEVELLKQELKQVNVTSHTSTIEKFHLELNFRFVDNGLFGVESNSPKMQGRT
jgi:hypothetical protein